MESNFDVKENKDGFLKKLKKTLKKEEPLFTAEYAWLETTYGDGSFKTVEERIKKKQEHIIHLIKSKFPSRNEGYVSPNTSGSYRCIVDIEEDLSCCVDEIFKPFIDGGFKIINLSKKVEEIEDENVFLISWKKVFNNKN